MLQPVLSYLKVFQVEPLLNKLKQLVMLETIQYWSTALDWIKGTAGQRCALNSVQFNSIQIVFIYTSVTIKIVYDPQQATVA